MTGGTRAAVFLDRDGVLIEDVDLLASDDRISILPDAPAALAALAGAGYALVVVSNQAAVARGLLAEEEIERLQRTVEQRLVAAGAPPLTAFYYCPHHPNADVAEYRRDCDCRKPRPGLLVRAARELDLDLASSFLIGDRLSDVAAGAAAGCRTILARTGRHDATPIESRTPVPPTLQPDFTCDSVGEAAQWILGSR